MREFTTCVRTGCGTQAVVINAYDVDDARERLLKLGYLEVIWVL